VLPYILGWNFYCERATFVPITQHNKKVFHSVGKFSVLLPPPSVAFASFCQGVHYMIKLGKRMRVLPLQHFTKFMRALRVCAVHHVYNQLDCGLFISVTLFM
jgi:hypothetical protein